MKKTETVAKNSVKSAGWNISANLFMTLCSFLRTYILARLLSVETFGIYGKALSFVFIALPLLWLGHGTAMLHRAPETEDEELNAAVLFSLSVISSFAWTVLMILAVNIFFDLADASTKIAFYGLIAAEALLNTTSAPRALFARQVNYKREALIVFAQFSTSTLLSILLAKLGMGIWALVSANLATSMIAFFMFYFWRPNFRPRFYLQKDILRYYYKFGTKLTLESLVYNFQERIDDLWAAMYLGTVAAGYYTQAHIVARYPLKIISLPVISVAGATFSALKNEKAALAQAFELVCSFLTRLTFFIGGAVLFASQEFVVLFLGDKWLPLLMSLRIMVVYMMFEPLKQIFSKTFSAIGQPELAFRARLGQLASLLVGIILFSRVYSWGIEGIALAVNISVLFGGILMAKFLRPKLKICWKVIFGPPVIAFIVAAVVTFMMLNGVQFNSIWLSALGKLSLWTIAYWCVELVIDRQYLVELLRIARKYV